MATAPPTPSGRQVQVMCSGCRTVLTAQVPDGKTLITFTCPICKTANTTNVQPPAQPAQLPNRMPPAQPAQLPNPTPSAMMTLHQRLQALSNSRQAAHENIALLQQLRQQQQPYLSGGPRPPPIPRAADTHTAGHSPAKPRANAVKPGQEDAHEEDDYAEVEVVVGDSFAAYAPAKWRFGVAHPHRVVESASLAAVEPPTVTYKLHINDVIAAEKLSIVQTEAIVYACQRFEHHLGTGDRAPRAGFFLGDGAGVGKGRTIAGLLLEQWRCGRHKAVWVSTSNDLVNDAKRDLADIGASFIPVIPLNKLPYKSLSGKQLDIKRGVLFVTYATLTSESDRVRSG